MARIAFRVTFDTPPNATPEDCEEYLRHAIRSYAGSLDYQNDPMARLERHTITILRYKRNG